jgi:hypothetical protein
MKVNFKATNQMIVKYLMKDDESKVSFMRFHVYHKTFDFFLGDWSRSNWKRRIKIERKALFKLNK